MGNPASVNCTTSSNGMIVNMNNIFANGIRFEEVVTDEAGVYKLSVHYFSKVVRRFRLIVNGGTPTVHEVAISGNWCFEAVPGSPAIYTVDIPLNAGVNTIELRPYAIGNTTQQSPIMDKINIAKVSSSARVMAAGAGDVEANVNAFEVYPNPVAANESFLIRVPASERESRLNILDLNGRARYTEMQEPSAGKTIRLSPSLPTGMYLIQIQNETQQQTRKLIVR